MKSAITGSLVLIVLALALATANGNAEVDALNAWKVALVDPYNVLQSWDPTLVNPCTWLHITCNNENRVTRVDLGDAGLSGPLVPQLGVLANLQYLEVYGNKLSGAIPSALGNLTGLISLDLYNNNFSGPIPDTIGNLRLLRYLRLQNNEFSGKLPDSIILLVNYGQLQILNVSENFLAGTKQATKKTGFAITTIIQDPKAGQA